VRSLYNILYNKLAYVRAVYCRKLHSRGMPRRLISLSGYFEKELFCCNPIKSNTHRPDIEGTAEILQLTSPREPALLSSLNDNSTPSSNALTIGQESVPDTEHQPRSSNYNVNDTSRHLELECGLFYE